MSRKQGRPSKDTDRVDQVLKNTAEQHFARELILLTDMQMCPVPTNFDDDDAVRKLTNRATMLQKQWSLVNYIAGKLCKKEESVESKVEKEMQKISVEDLIRKRLDE